MLCIRGNPTSCNIVFFLVMQEMMTQAILLSRAIYSVTMYIRDFYDVQVVTDLGLPKGPYLLVFRRKDLCEVRVKPEISSNFQITFSDIPPTWNCQYQEMRSLLIYVVNESPFETDGRIRSSFQMKCSDILPTWNYQYQEMRSLRIFVVNESPFETDSRIRSSDI